MRTTRFFISLCLAVLLVTWIAPALYAQSVLTRGKNLPVWGLAVEGPSVQQIDWRTNIPVVSSLTNSGPSKVGSPGVAINDCGKLAFYVLHSGVDAANQLHIYDASGTRLTNTISGDLKQALNSAGAVELQVVRVPGKADEWFIVYSLFQGLCYTGPPGSGYCPAKVVYAHVKYNPSDGLVIASGKREIPIAPGKTFIQGRAVSRTVNGDPSRHYLYLAERQSNTLRLHRYIIDGNGISIGTVSPSIIPAGYWVYGTAGSGLELSPDETKVAISNRNIRTIKEDLIIFDLKWFYTQGYVPPIISAPNLIVYGTGKTVGQLSQQAGYACFANLKNKLSSIEFSPSGRYLYVGHGGYVPGTGGKPYDTYLLQIDLQSSTTGNYVTRMQIEKGGSPASCVGSESDFHMQGFIGQIQTAYDGKLYFTKSRRSTLFVIPNPDDPMPHSLVPGVVDLSTPSSPNIQMQNGAYVGAMPENIDGYDYLKENPSSTFFSLDKTSANAGDNILLTVSSYSGDYTYQVNWGDGVVEMMSSATQSHSYSAKGKYRIVLTAMHNSTQCASLYWNEVSVLDCTPMATPMEITNTQILCATKFSVPKRPDCYATYEWNFGDNTPVSKNRSPLHVYNNAGTYTVTATVNYNCEACRDEVIVTKQVSVTPAEPQFEDKVLQIPSDQRLNIISSSATTFSERWPLDHNEPGLENLNGFISGAQGLWRNEGSFVYNTPRSASESVNIRTDGTYTLEYFNWPNANLEVIPKWVKASNATRFNAYGFELENKDVLDVYSAALYDYSGQLQSAHGVNMRNDEMGFTSFEGLSNKPTGNFIFSNLGIPSYKDFKVNAGNSHVAVIEATLADLQNADKADIAYTMHTNLPLLSFMTIPRYLKDVKILCKSAHPTNPALTILVFETEPFSGVWTGQIRIKNLVVPTVTASIDNSRGHTGKSSIVIGTDQVFEQRLIRMEAGKTYHFNAWVSVGNSQVTIPKLANNLGIDVILKNKAGTTKAIFLIVPEGRVIEGWQQVKGSFTCPEKDLILSLKFKRGSAGAWYDDIRLHPDNGNMKSYVYDVNDFRLKAILDENNFASMFYYDKEGNLYLTKKETEDGIKTITENISYQVEQQN